MKKVLVIGNGTSCIKEKLGKKIDSEFDLVIRLNDYITSGFEEYIGTKEDIWCTGGGTATIPRNCQKFKNVWISYPFVCNNIMSNLAARVTMDSPFTLMGVNFLKNLDEQVGMPKGFFCTCGLYAIGFAIKQFQQVHIIGFDFFKDCASGKNVNHYYGEHKTEKVGSDHRPDLEEQFVKKLILNKQVIQL